MDWTIRRMEKDDRSAYVQLLGQWITRIPVEDHFRWLYLENPHGQALTWLAVRRDDGRIIGATSIFPKKVRVRGSVSVGSVGGDTFVSPDFRRRGVAKKLHEVSMGEMVSTGVRFHYGFPNRPNLGAILKAGALHPGDFSEAMFLLGVEPVLNKFSVPRPFRNVISKAGNAGLSAMTRIRLAGCRIKGGQLKRIASFDARMEPFLKKAVEKLSIACLRDGNYLTWRFFRNPAATHEIYIYEIDGEPCGYAALEFSNYRCVLFDFLVEKSRDNAQPMIGEIIRLARGRGAQLIEFFVNPKGPYVGNFQACGFRMRTMKRIHPMIVFTEMDREDVEFMSDIRNWYLTYADMDIEAVGRGAP